MSLHGVAGTSGEDDVRTYWPIVRFKIFFLNFFIFMSELYVSILFLGDCGDNCYSNRSNISKDWPDVWTTLMPTSNNLIYNRSILSHSSI